MKQRSTLVHSKLLSASTLGIDSQIIEVEADLSYGLLNFHIVGLAEKTIKESKERIRAALKNTGLKIPEKLITVNLAPADLKKEDTLDVPIAVAILAASAQIQQSLDFWKTTLFLGELALDGTIRRVSGVTSIACRAVESGAKRIVLPESNAEEAAVVSGIEVIGVQTLASLVRWLRGEERIEPTNPKIWANDSMPIFSKDFCQVLGQKSAKTALEIAAAGWHNTIFVGPPGSGKTMLAERLISILPPLSYEESVETTKIYSVAGQLEGQALVRTRPFRAPHHTTSQAGLVGGGSIPRPGEISLAHNGVLFLDELAEFRRTSLEALRQPLESKTVTISRANLALAYPADFLLIAATNPCPCGYSPEDRCICSATTKDLYRGKISGPLLDRIDLHVCVTRPTFDQLCNKTQNSCQDQETSEIIYKRVEKARQFAASRQGKIKNSALASDKLQELCPLSQEAEITLQAAFSKLSLSARAYHKVLRVARTIADLGQSQIIDERSIKRAIGYRFLDKN